MSASKRQIFVLRIALVVMLAGAAVLVFSKRPPFPRLLAAASSLMCAGALYLALREANDDSEKGPRS